MKPIATLFVFFALIFNSGVSVRAVEQVDPIPLVEMELKSEKTYHNPFTEVELDAVITAPDGQTLRVPGFWAGGDRWRFRYASNQGGEHQWRTECSDTDNASLHGVSGTVVLTDYIGNNPLFRHGQLRMSENGRHLEHADGTPFFWLGDTWWKCLSKRMTWEGFQELTADRAAKEFNVVHIVCGAYPDENHFQERWKNEAGFPYHRKDFSEVNPAYFDYADRRIRHLVENGIVPAIVGGWGRADCNIMELVGIDGMKRHWRYLIARYGAFTRGVKTLRLTAGVSGSHAFLHVSNGKEEYQTPAVPVKNAHSGTVGVRLHEVGNRQQFDNFSVSPTPFENPRPVLEDEGEFIRKGGGDFIAPEVPTPQDWILVLERVGGKT